LADGSTLRVEESTTIRFLVDGSAADEQALDVRTGDALLITGRHELRLRTHLGVATLSAGGQVRLKRQGQELEFHVDIGEVRFRDEGGATVDVKAGETIQVGIGMAVLRKSEEPAELSAGPAAAPLSPQVPEPEAPSDVGQVDPEQAAREVAREAAKAGVSNPQEPVVAGPTYFYMSVPAGESFTVHASEVPVAVRFAFGDKCEGEGEVELVAGNQRSRGHGTANLLFAQGTRNYLVHCIDDKGVTQRKAVAHGAVHVLRDSGTDRLPPRAPTSLVEADGRSYTVYYQNQLPEVRVRWPNPPQAAQYGLTIDRQSSTLTQPEFLFRSGSLREGVHQVTFSAAGRRSRTTAFEISFDNAAPKAILNSPTERAFRVGETVRVEGVVLPSWKVSIPGGTLKQDANDRFSGEVATSAEYPDIAVRLAHPRLGTHYYLRRAAESH
jgi:hypothetical protein